MSLSIMVILEQRAIHHRKVPSIHDRLADFVAHPITVKIAAYRIIQKTNSQPLDFLMKRIGVERKCTRSDFKVSIEGGGHMFIRCLLCLSMSTVAYVAKNHHVGLGPRGGFLCVV